MFYIGKRINFYISKHQFVWYGSKRNYGLWWRRDPFEKRFMGFKKKDKGYCVTREIWIWFIRVHIVKHKKDYKWQ